MKADARILIETEGVDNYIVQCERKHLSPETRSYVNLSLSQPKIRLSSLLNSEKILGVLKEGSTSWPHICTETQINYMRNKYWQLREEE